MFLRLFIGIALILPVFAACVILALIFGFLFRAIRLKKASRAIVQAFLGIAVRWVMLCLGSKVTILGRENIPAKGEKYCMIPNHLSMIDIPAIYMTGRWPGMVSKAETWKVPFLHGILCLLDCVKLNRKSPKDAIRAIHDGVENIKKGIPMLIFPEGTRSKTGEMATLKAGSFKMATRANAKVVPVVLKNTRQCLEDARYFGIVPVYVQILPAIDTEGMSPEEMQELPMRVETMLREAYEKLPAFPKKKN